MVHHANTINHAFKLTLYIKIANPIPLTIPTIGRTGTNGTLNDGLYFELVFLNFINATQTILNKIKNIILVLAAISFSGIIFRKMIIIIPDVAIPR